MFFEVWSDDVHICSVRTTKTVRAGAKVHMMVSLSLEMAISENTTRKDAVEKTDSKGKPLRLLEERMIWSCKNVHEGAKSQRLPEASRGLFRCSRRRTP
jgi:hypothetical protein